MRLRNDTDYPLHAMTDPPQTVEPGESIDHDVETLGVIAGLTAVPDDEPESTSDDGEGDGEGDGQDEAPVDHSAPPTDVKTRRTAKQADITDGGGDNDAR